jgi:hypothetical protein
MSPQAVYGHWSAMTLEEEPMRGKASGGKAALDPSSSVPGGAGKYGLACSSSGWVGVALACF